MSSARAVLVSAACVAVLGLSPSAASAAPHPHFNDRGTLVWYRSLPEAQAAARSSGKLVFIESGRLECGSCRKLVEKTLPQEPIRSRLAAVAVGLADDCDVTSSATAALLARNLPGASLLPLVGFVTPDGRWVTGWFGGATPAQVLGHLDVAEKACARLRSQGAAPDVPPSAAPSTPPCAPPSTPQVTRPVLPTPRGMSPAPTPAPTPAPRVAPPPVVRVRPAPPVTPSPVARAPVAPFATTRPAPRAPVVVPRGPVAPSAPRTATPTPPALAQAQAPAAKPAGASGSATDKDPRSRARIAAETGDWGCVLRIWDEAGDARDASLMADLSPWAERAHLWCLRQVDDAERAAGERRYDEAMRSLDLVRRSLEGTSCPIAVDAERGQRAIERLMAIEQGSPDQADAPEVLRRRAYQDFRGSRWAPLFRSRS